MATSHTRLRARDHYTSSTLIGGKGGASPSSLHTTLEGPTEYVNALWIESTWIPKWHRMDHISWSLHSKVRDHTTLFWRCIGTTFGHFLLGSHNFTVTTLGLCVKWP
jgi:hypothetical protein